MRLLMRLDDNIQRTGTETDDAERGTRPHQV
jgi:hypothetical protein